MQCRCPVCGGLTQVPSDLLNYLVRCDACGGLLRPIMTPKENGRETLKAEPANVGRVREIVSSNAGIAELLSPPMTKRRNRSEPPPIQTEPPPFRTEPPPIPSEISSEIPQVSLAEMSEIAAVSKMPPRRRGDSGRSIGIITASVLGAVALIGAIVFVAAVAGAKPARATSAGNFVSAPAPANKKAESPPKHVVAKVATEHVKSAAKVDPRVEPAPKAAAIEEPVSAEPNGKSESQTNAGELFPGVK